MALWGPVCPLKPLITRCLASGHTRKTGCFELSFLDGGRLRPGFATLPTGCVFSALEVELQAVSSLGNAYQSTTNRIRGKKSGVVHFRNPARISSTGRRPEGRPLGREMCPKCPEGCPQKRLPDQCGGWKSDEVLHFFRAWHSREFVGVGGRERPPTG